MDIDDRVLKRGNWAAAGVSPDFLKSCWTATDTQYRDFAVRSNQRSGSSSLLRGFRPSETLLKLSKEQNHSISRLIKGHG